MSKFKELVAKYKITAAAAKKFYESDETPTKKYFEYMVKMWINKTNNGIRYTNEITDAVREFNNLLPYIKNKDIYNELYSNFGSLKSVIDKAAEEKENKNFNREEHILVLDETEDYLFLSPITHKGSCKYGAKTKWCTSAKDGSYFYNYTKNGFLAYLISKKEDKSKNFNKIAFHIQYDGSPYTDVIKTYNAVDHEKSDKDLINANWSSDVILKLITILRIHASKYEKIQESKDAIDKICLYLTNINILDLNKHMNVVESSMNGGYISEVKNTFDNFVNQVKKFQNEYTKA